jgi:hypothetical protein
VHVKSHADDNLKVTAAGVVAGSTLGVLNGLGIFALPGLGFLFGAGAIVGGIAGLELGVVGSALFSLFSTIGFKKEEIVKAIKKALFDKDFRAMVSAIKNPYGSGDSSKKIVDILRTVKLDGIVQKIFHD